MSIDENFKTSRIPLKRSASSIGFSCSCLPNPNLRVTKSYTVIMGLNLNIPESKATQMNTTTTGTGNCGELFSDVESSDETIIKTVDVITNKIFYFKESLLRYQGKTYPMNDICCKWKKDCRMWLWKNRPRKSNIGDLYNGNAALTI